MMKQFFVAVVALAAFTAGYEHRNPDGCKWAATLKCIW